MSRMSASELRDVAEVLELQQAQLRAQEKKLAEHDAQFAIVHRAQQTFENQIEIFRTGMKEANERHSRAMDDKFKGLLKLIDLGFKQLRKDMMNGHGE